MSKDLKLGQRLNELLITKDGSRRRSVGVHRSRKCTDFFQHPSAFEHDGLRVLKNAHTSRLMSTQVFLAVEVLEWLMDTKRLSSLSSPVRLIHSCIDADTRTTYYTFIHSTPYSNPKCTHVRLLEEDETLGVRLGIAHELTKEFRSIPFSFCIHEVNFSEWRLVENISPMYHQCGVKINSIDHPHAYAALRDAAYSSYSKESFRFHATDVLPPGAHMIFVMDAPDGTKRSYQPRYQEGHAVMAALTPGDAFILDPNGSRSNVFNMASLRFMRSLDPKTHLMPTPSINQGDTAEMQRQLASIDITTQVTVAGYCASITLALLVDFLCTDDTSYKHYMRFLQDFSRKDKRHQLSVVVYARAIATDMVRAAHIYAHKTSNYLPRSWKDVDMETEAVLKWNGNDVINVTDIPTRRRETEDSGPPPLPRLKPIS